MIGTMSQAAFGNLLILFVRKSANKKWAAGPLREL